MKTKTEYNRDRRERCRRDRTCVGCSRKRTAEEEALLCAACTKNASDANKKRRGSAPKKPTEPCRRCGRGALGKRGKKTGLCRGCATLKTNLARGRFPRADSQYSIVDPDFDDS